MISWDELSHQWTKIWIGTGYSPINYLNQCWLIVNWATSIGRNIKGIWIKLLNCYFDEKHQVPFIDLNIFLPKNCSNSFQALMCLGQKYSINKYIMHSIDNTIVLKVSPINNITNIGQTSAIPNTDLVTWNLDTQALPLRWWKYLVINLSSTPVSRNRRILNKKTTHILTHLPLDKLATISLTIFSYACSWMKRFVFWLKFHWSLFLKIQLTISQHWFR